MNEYVDFVDKELSSILEPGEEVRILGLAQDSNSWLLSFLWRLALRFYFVVVTDRRLILLKTKSKFTWTMKLVPKCKLQGVQSVPFERISHVISNSAMNLLNTMFGLKGYAIAMKSGKPLPLMVPKKEKLLPDQGRLQATIENADF